jgi:hypothetical protein
MFTFITQRTADYRQETYMLDGECLRKRNLRRICISVRIFQNFVSIPIPIPILKKNFYRFRFRFRFLDEKFYSIPIPIPIPMKIS